MRRKKKSLQQLSLFTSEQMAGMEKLPPSDPEPDLEIKPGVVAYSCDSQALLDCLADAGYRGSDPVFDFFSGREPTHKPRLPGRRN